MEHNEYSLHKVQVKLKLKVRQPDDFCGGTMELKGHETDVHSFNIVAPSGEFGEELVRLHLKNHHAYSDKLSTGETHIIVSHVQEPIEHIVRFEAAYRGRM